MRLKNKNSGYLFVHCKYKQASKNRHFSIEYLKEFQIPMPANK